METGIIFILFFILSLQVIFYEIPIMGKTHYSPHPWGISQEKQSTRKKPRWIKDLENKSPIVDLVLFLSL